MRYRRYAQTKRIAELEYKLDGLGSLLGAPLQPSLRGELPPLAPSSARLLPNGSSSTGSIPEQEYVTSHTSRAVQENQPVFYTTEDSQPPAVAVNDRQTFQRMVLYQELVEELMERLLILGRKNIDLLQGLLVFISLFVAYPHITIWPNTDRQNLDITNYFLPTR